MTGSSLNFLCISTFYKGVDFLKRCKAEGNNVYLLTKKKLENEDWPWDAIDEVFYIEEWNQNNITTGPDVITTYKNLARLYEKMGQKRLAEAIRVKLMKMEKK